MHATQPFSILGTQIAITSNTAATASVVTTTSAHGGTTGDMPTISGVSGSVPSINGIRPITVLSNVTFSVPVTTTTGGTGGSVNFNSVSLGSTFKKLSGEKSPVSYNDANSTAAFPIPVQIISRAQSDRLAYSPLSSTLLNAFPIQFVYLEKNGPAGNWALYLPAQYQPVAITFNVSGFWFPDDLSLGTDHNQLTDHPDLCEALVNLAKAQAYFAEEVDSIKGTAAMALYEQACKSAAYSDVSQQFSGRSLKM